MPVLEAQSLGVPAKITQQMGLTELSPGVLASEARSFPTVS